MIQVNNRPFEWINNLTVKKLLEIKNYEIINSKSQTKLINNKEKPVMLLSSVSSEYNSLRTSLAGSMLNTLKVI